MLKNIELFLIHFMIFWILVSTMPGVASPNGSAGYFITATLYGLLILVLPEILRFFRFPKNVWGKLLIGGGLTFVFLWVISVTMPDIMNFSRGFVGDFDFIWFTTPKIFTLPNALSVIGFVSVFVNICSIILQFLNKGKF